MARRNKPRKWSNLKGTVPQVPVEISPRQEQVFQQRDERRGQGMPDLTTEWAKLEAADTVAADAQSKRNITYDALEVLMLEELEKIQTLSGQDQFRGPDGTFSPKNTLYPTVKDEAALKAWVIESGMSSMLELPRPRLASIVAAAYDMTNADLLTPAARAGLKPGQPMSGMPPPGVEVFIKTTVHHAGGKSTTKGGNGHGEDEQGNP